MQRLHAGRAGRALHAGCSRLGLQTPHWLQLATDPCRPVRLSTEPSRLPRGSSGGSHARSHDAHTIA